MPFIGFYKIIKENVKKVLHYYAKRANIRVGKGNSGLNSESLEDTASAFTTKKQTGINKNVYKQV